MTDGRRGAGTILAVAIVVLAALAGVLLGALTKATLWLYEVVIDAVWEWLPGQLGIDGRDIGFLVAVLGIGGLLVGLGQRVLGYHPPPLEETIARVRGGDGIDPRSLPKVLANTIASLGAGAPLGPEAGLISVVGGVFFWLQGRMRATTTRARNLLLGTSEVERATPWRYAPAIVTGVALIVTFRALPGGMDLSYVPAEPRDLDLGMLVLVIVGGLAGGVIGRATSEVEDRVRALRLFDRAPIVVAVAGGLAVAILALPSPLVLFSGSHQMPALFDGSAEPAELLYVAGAKWLALIIVLATGWKGGTIFPLMFIAGAVAVSITELAGLEPTVVYAAVVGGAVAGSMRSIAIAIVVALLVVPASLLLALAGGAAAGVSVARLTSRIHGATVAERAA
jgi:H+/Cl- antiporter ClcA